MPPLRTPGGSSIAVPPFARPAACQALAASGEAAAKPTVPPLAALAFAPSIGLVIAKMPVGVM